MAKARGRGAVAGLGFALLFAGLIGGVVLWILAMREPDRAAEGFARAAPGCRTTLSFSETGEFYLYEELSGVVVAEGCEPDTAPGQAFTWELLGPDGEPVDAIDDTSVSYALDVGAGTSLARVDIDRAGSYEIEVRGNDPAVVAAIGRDPDENVIRLRAAAIAAALIGIAGGGMMLWLSGRRSRRAAAMVAPADPGWGVTERDHARRAGSGDGDDVWRDRSAAQEPTAPRGALEVPDEASAADPTGDHEWPPRPPSLADVGAESVEPTPPAPAPWAPPSADTVRQAGGEDDVPPPPN